MVAKLEELVQQRRTDALGRLNGVNVMGMSASQRDSILAMREIASRQLLSVVDLLPTLFRIKGRRCTLEDHFVFEPMFKTVMPDVITWVTGRQVSKSTSLALQGITTSLAIPYFNTLFITPLYEMIRRFSTNYVRELIDSSPLRNIWLAGSSSSNVLQRTLANKSTMYFTYALTDCTRARGVPGDKVTFDEAQDMDPAHPPVIVEATSGSPYQQLQVSGTPKTSDTYLQQRWDRSSMAEWVMRCGCGYFNIPSLDHDLDKIVGPYRDDISEERPGLICAKCSHPLRPRDGRWYHRKPSLAASLPGYHVPQFLLPNHYANPRHWSKLLLKRAASLATYYNECCGVCWDVSTALLSKHELMRAACLNENTLDAALAVASQYETRFLVADWGGGGLDEISWTVYTVLGYRPETGQIDAIYSIRSLTPHDQEREAGLGINLLNAFRCQRFVHDYTGAGAFREKLIIDAGYPQEWVIPIWYTRAATQNIMRRVLASDAHPRTHWKLDKPRAIILALSQIREGRVRLFKHQGDEFEESDASLLRDLLSLVEDKIDARLGRDLYTIIHKPHRSDDFAQTIAMGCAAIWYYYDIWPVSSATDRYRISQEWIQETLSL